MIFGTDWPGIPGIAHNARAVAELCCPTTRRATWCSPPTRSRVYNLKLEQA